MKRTTMSLVLAALALPVVAAAAPAAPAASAAPTPNALTGFQQLDSGYFTIPGGQQVAGTMSCPVGSKAVGGGPASSYSPYLSANASYPTQDGRTWRVYMNNSGTSSIQFTVQVTCVQQVVNYTVVQGTGVTNPAGRQNTALATCPTGTVPFGGGGLGTSYSTSVNLNSSLPSGNGWRVDVNNGSTGTNSAIAYAVCGQQPAGYTVVIAPPVTVDAWSPQVADLWCPVGTSVFTGGGLSSSPSTSIVLTDFFAANDRRWDTYSYNGTSSGTTTLKGYAVCGTVG